MSHTGDLHKVEVRVEFNQGGYMSLVLTDPQWEEVKTVLQHVLDVIPIRMGKDHKHQWVDVTKLDDAETHEMCTDCGMGRLTEKR